MMKFWWNAQDSSPPLHLPISTGPHAVGFQDVMTPGPADKGGINLFFGLEDVKLIYY